MSDNEALRHDARELEHLLTVATIENERLRGALTEARTVIDDQIHVGVLLRATSLQVLTKIDAALAKEMGK
jgi:chromosome condensin MukBEF complex kleisin-like MukF subunit